MIPKELLKKIRTIEISTNRLVTDSLGGNYESVFKGQGMEFSEVREYQFGDDIRSIDWNVTARQRKPYIKKFIEERELTVILMVDVSASKGFATQGQKKKELAAEISALLAFSAIRNSDRVGLLLFSDQVEAYVPPRKDRQHILRLIRDVLYFKPKHTGTDLAGALEYLSRVHPRQAVTFILSDFFDKGFEKRFKQSSRKYDLIPIMFRDPAEMDLPKAGYVELQDFETGELVSVHTDRQDVRQQFANNYQEWFEQKIRFFKRQGTDVIDIVTNEPYVKPITQFFQKRMARK